MLVIEVNDADLRRAAAVYLSTLSGEAQKATRATAENAREHIASGAYWTNRSSKTGQSFTVDTDPEALGATLSSNSKVARFLEAGTKPHLIRPRLAAGFVGPAQSGQGRGGRGRSVLRFVPAGGGVVFARVVKHPGTKPRFYIAAEAARTEPLLHTAVEHAADTAATRSGLD